jgi:hypothetical protein
MTWLRAGTAGFDATFALRPHAHTRFRELYDGLWSGGVDGGTLDACEARIAALVQVSPDPTTDLTLGDAQRAAVDFAEQYALDPHGLRDADFERLHEFYDDAQLATLTLAVAMFDARARFSVALEV